MSYVTMINKHFSDGNFGVLSHYTIETFSQIGNNLMWLKFSRSVIRGEAHVAKEKK